MDAFFLHYVPHSVFDAGIFVPFATQEEAERQAAWDIANGMDPEFIEQIFRAEHAPQKFGWTQASNPDPPHFDKDRRERLRTRAAIAKLAPKLAKQLVEEAKVGEEERLLEIHRRIQSGEAFENSVPGNGYVWATNGTTTGGAAALSAATAKTLVLLLAATANQMSIPEISISFDGVTASAVPVLVELVSGTAGGAGTPRTTLAAGKQTRGWPAQTSVTTCGDTYSAEPTTQLANKKWLVSPNGGSLTIQNPLGRETTGIITSATDGKTWSIRATAPATVNCHAYMEFEE